VKRKFARRANLPQGDGQALAGALPQPIAPNQFAYERTLEAARKNIRFVH
jgi:hypothetical protein